MITMFKAPGGRGKKEPDPSPAPSLTGWVTLGLTLPSLGLSVYLGNAAAERGTAYKGPASRDTWSPQRGR